MIEVIYKEETDNTKENAECVKLPNNVRQIGEIKGQKKTIYGRLCLHLFEKDRAEFPTEMRWRRFCSVPCHWTSQGDYIFIRSALQIRDLELSPEHIRLTIKSGDRCMRTAKNYFPEQEIVGWFAGFPGFNMEITERRSERRIWIILQEMTKCCSDGTGGDGRGFFDV